MAQFSRLESRAVVLPIDNIDTDQIIPARFLKTTDKEGLGQVLFCDWRYTATVSTIEAAGEARSASNFALNDPRNRGAQILVAGENFGCGSSREHAPWALLAYGFRVVIAPSFANIFENNALKNGLLPVAVDRDTHHRLLDMADDTILIVDLETQTMEMPSGLSVRFPIDPFAKRCLLQGDDQLSYLMSFEEQIAEHESKAPAYVRHH